MLNNSFKRSFFLLGSILLMISCGQKRFDSREDLMTHIINPENGYTQEKSINGIDFSITYRPTDILVEQMLSENPTQKEIDSLRHHFVDYLYFNLSISKNDQEVLNGLAINRNEFGAMVNQLAFGMSDKVHLMSKSRDTVELLDYNYPRLYGMGGATNLLLVYSKDEKILEEEFIRITIEDIGLNTGEVGFKIPTRVVKENLILKL